MIFALAGADTLLIRDSIGDTAACPDPAALPRGPMGRGADPKAAVLCSAAVLGQLDSRLLYAMRTRFHGPAAETAVRWVGRIGEYGAVWFVIGIVLAFVDPDNGEDWVVAGILGPVAIGLNFIVKVVVRRPRPVLEGLPPLGGAPSSLSFPSAHATSSFACATAMTRIAPEAAILFVLAAALAVGRPYLGMHYPSDVLAGAVLGTALGLIVPL
jgi:membrane-associated phospholipid phosphatase